MTKPRPVRRNFASWEDFLHRTTEAKRLRFAKKAKVANRERLMSVDLTC